MVLKQAEIRLLDKGGFRSRRREEDTKKGEEISPRLSLLLHSPFQGAAPLPEPALDYSPIVSGATISWVRIST